MTPPTYIKSLVCLALSAEDWNTLQEIADDAGDSVAGTASGMISVVLERLREETEYIDSLASKAEEDESSPTEYELPSLFL